VDPPPPATMPPRLPRLFTAVQWTSAVIAGYAAAPAALAAEAAGTAAAAVAELWQPHPLCSGGGGSGGTAPVAARTRSAGPGRTG
jgi:hypothetical protein